VLKKRFAEGCARLCFKEDAEDEEDVEDVEDVEDE
jgi:hypothetical protein